MIEQDVEQPVVEQPVVEGTATVVEQPATTEAATETQTAEAAEQTEQSAEDKAAEAQRQQANAPKKGKGLIDRVGELTRKNADLQRRAEIAEAAAEAARNANRQNAEEQITAEANTTGLSAAEIDRMVNERASVLAAQQTYTTRLNKMAASGTAEYGVNDFNDKCNIVASLGGERPEFMSIITDPDLMPEGHKVIGQLADNPEEAIRILSLPPVQMAAALTRFADAKLAKAAPAAKVISSAPKPITPIDGTNKGSAEPSDNDSSADWFKKRQAQWAARGGQPGVARY